MVSILNLIRGGVASVVRFRKRRCVLCLEVSERRCGLCRSDLVKGVVSVKGGVAFAGQI